MSAIKYALEEIWLRLWYGYGYILWVDAFIQGFCLNIIQPRTCIICSRYSECLIFLQSLALFFFFCPAFSLSGLNDDSSSSPPPSAPPLSSPLSRSASWEGLSELPTLGTPLQHVTRVRPKPPRKHRGGHTLSDTVRKARKNSPPKHSTWQRTSLICWFYLSPTQQ